MALNPVSLVDYLRLWHYAGITHFFAPGLACEPDFGFSAQSTSPSCPTQSAELLPPAGCGDLPDSPCLDQAVFSPSGLSSPSFCCSGTDSGAVGEAAPESVPEQQNDTDAAWLEFLLTEPWRSLLSKTPAAPLLWSYQGLLQDLSGQASSRRSTFIRSLIGSLKLPKGSNCFFPLCALCQAYPPAASPPLFDDLLQRLHPRVVLFFGADSVLSLKASLPLSFPFTQHIRAGRLFILLPDLAAFDSSADLFQKTFVFLRARLGALTPLLQRG